MSHGPPKFRLDPRLPIGRAVREAALGQLDSAISGLERGGDAEAIHEARKVCKKLRALLRLLRPQLGRSYRAENARLREAGRAMAGGREATVLLETADALFGENAALAALAQRLHERPVSETHAALDEACLLLATERRRVAEWPVDALSVGGLMVGLLAGYRRGRDAWRVARGRPTAATLHTWRKQAKYHGYQCALVGPIWPEAGRGVSRLKKLSDLLGAHHDLHVLALTLRRERASLGDPELLRAARARLEARQRALAVDALYLGRRLFDDRPVAWLDAPAPR